MFPIDVLPEHQQTASDWHSGQSSAFYSIASTGEIFSGEYLFSALSEVNSDLRSCKDEEEREKLISFRNWLEEIEKEFAKFWEPDLKG